MRPPLIIIVGFLSLLLLWLYFSATDEEPALLSRTQELAGEEFDYFINNLDSTYFGEDGKRLYRLQARRLTHFPEPDFATLEQPYLTVYQENAAPWQIQANNARIETDPELDQERIDLIGDVVITRNEDEAGEVNIYTRFLSVYPDAQVARTHMDVLMTSAGSEVSGTGMRAELLRAYIHLLANVRGYYE